MSLYLIAVTAQHDAVDYDFFRKLARDHRFDFYMTRIDDTNRRNMTFAPKSYTSALNHHDVIEKLQNNSPLLVTYEIQALEENL